MASSTVHVEGIRELRTALRRTNPELLKELRTELKRAATPVANDARRRVNASIKNRGRSTGRTRASIRVGVSGNKVYIAGGKSKVPYYGWLDFGGDLAPTGRRSNYQTRTKLKKGRFLYPAIDANMPLVLLAIDKALTDATRKAFK